MTEKGKEKKKKAWEQTTGVASLQDGSLSYLLAFTSSLVPSHTAPGGSVIKRIEWKRWYVTSDAVIKDTWASFLVHPSLFLFRKPAAML